MGQKRNQGPINNIYPQCSACITQGEAANGDDYLCALEPKNDWKTIAKSPYLCNITLFIWGTKIILAKNDTENSKMPEKIITPGSKAWSCNMVKFSKLLA